MKKSIPKLRLA